MFSRFLVLAAFLALCGCGTSDEALLGGEDLSYDVGNCGPRDQKGSYQPPLLRGPEGSEVVVNFQGLEANEKIKAQNAIEVWNQQIRSIQGRELWVAGDGGDTSLRSPSANDCGSFQGGRSEVFIRGVSENQWAQLRVGDATRGLTLRCYADKKLRQQQILVRTGGSDDSQLMSVILHELGHALGLDHSCDDRNRHRPEYRDCHGLGFESDYRQAVMFPTLQRSGDGRQFETKENIRPNDSVRANCLLGPG